jgi:aspartokinase
LNDHEGTHIKERNGLTMEEFGITGITADSEKVFIQITLARPTVLAALWDRAARSHLSVISPIFFDGEVRFFSDRDGLLEWRKHLEELTVDGFVKKYSVESEIIPLSVIGDRFSQDGTALQRILEVLAGANISVTLGSASALAMTVGVARSRAQEGVQVLHRELLKA